MMSFKFSICAVFCLASLCASAQLNTPVKQPPTVVPPQSFIERYQARVTATQSAQPHWVTPLVTVTPRLEQEFRTDFARQTNAKLYETWNYGNGKGLEIIPARRIELLFNLPPFFAHRQSGVKDGFGDVSFNSKFRIFARNAEHGNAILTAFLAATVPTAVSYTHLRAHETGRNLV